ncbi:hypothetical protein [Mesobacterium pallidum]|uniref:hypothetical protein n=1 Tax=Mesobacterium pallidum TaxID=2872037 RepID=UPI001EE17B79|nr:hypothetical protein [Mesobacterium pallidum]
MKVLVFLSLLVVAGLLSACNTAGRGFGGVPAKTLTVDGARFDIRQVGGVAEAIRTSAHPLPRFDWVALRGAMAIQIVTGCEPKWIVGDPSVLRAGLSCNGAAPPRVTATPKQVLCEVSNLRRGIGDVAEGDLTCSR